MVVWGDVSLFKFVILLEEFVIVLDECMLGVNVICFLGFIFLIFLFGRKLLFKFGFCIGLFNGIFLILVFLFDNERLFFV